MASKSVPATVEQILVYLDGSELGEAGLGYALAISRATGASLLLLDVVDSAPGVHPRPVDALEVEMARVEAARYLHSVAARLMGEGPEEPTKGRVDILTETVEGRPADQILQVAEREEVDLIVLAAHGAPDAGRFRMGATAQKVSQHARQSLLIVRSKQDEPALQRQTIERVLVLLDGSIAAESSLPSALELARTMGTEIVLGHALVRPVFPTCQPPTRGDTDLLAQLAERSHELARAYLRNLERSLRGEGVYCRAVIKECDSVRQGVIALAEDEDVDLILLTSHGHTSSNLVVHGGITQQLLMHATRPLWVIQNLHHGTQTTATTMRPEEMRNNVSHSH